MAANIAHVEVVPVASGAEVPSCPHGPTLLFERYDSSRQTVRQFFACSAFRDRKACNFFRWADLSTSENSNKHQCNLQASFTSHKEHRKRYREFKKLPIEERSICCTCGLLLTGDEKQGHKSKGHILKNKVKLKDLQHASTLFMPLDNNKTFAQYLFSEGTVSFILDTLSSLGYTNVLCVGALRIHEAIQVKRKQGDNSLTSMLLDLDDRYAQLYSPLLFAKYNMFNDYYFECSARANVLDFFSKGKDRCVLLTDPPFGGMVDPLAKTFKTLSEMWQDAVQDDDVNKKGIPLIWFFPYFMECRVRAAMPDLLMLDYKVNYDNHALYKNNGKKRGSPVRIFTNIHAESFKLPAEDGYWFCDICQRYSSPENWHCPECNACASKDGSHYVHCDMCERCVKPSRVHCFKCNTCETQDHQCGKRKPEGCHVCGSLEHKRKECPNRAQNSASKQQSQQKRSLKRKAHSSSALDCKKKKKRRR